MNKKKNQREKTFIQGKNLSPSTTKYHPTEKSNYETDCELETGTR